MKSSWFLLIYAGYFVSFVLYFTNFEIQKESFYFRARGVAALSLLAHFFFLLSSFLSAGRLAVSSLSEYIEMVSFLILTVSFVIETRAKAKSLMLFVLPIVLVFCAFAVFLAEQKNVPVQSRATGWLWLHTGLILTGFSGLIIAVSSAIMYLLQSAQLKSKHLGKVFLKLPSLDVLDRLHFVSLAWGVILFSLGMITGLLWIKTPDQLKEVMKDPTVILSFLTSFMYWVILSFRFSSLRRGQKIALGTVLVFTLLFMTLFTSNYLPTGIHRGF